ncbi:MAG TPA: hypothetical protein VFQ34_11405 [Nitrospiraceae bacterium]|jgi:hypothetical protein|nr:hypothetical protein [Nitrospiraceae bacterium]
MSDAVGEKHQVAGFDDQARGFNRPVEFLITPNGCRAVLRYEKKRILSPDASGSTEALRQLIAVLQGEGYRQLRSQQSYRNGTYLGSQEPWIEYPDPPAPSPGGLLALLRRWWK